MLSGVFIGSRFLFGVTAWETLGVETAEAIIRSRLQLSVGLATLPRFLQGPMLESASIGFRFSTFPVPSLFSRVIFDVNLTPRTIQQYHIFVASPGDVGEERQIVRNFFDRYNRYMGQLWG